MFVPIVPYIPIVPFIHREEDEEYNRKRTLTEISRKKSSNNIEAKTQTTPNTLEQVPLKDWELKEAEQFSNESYIWENCN